MDETDKTTLLLTILLAILGFIFIIQFWRFLI